MRTIAPVAQCSAALEVDEGGSAPRARGLATRTADDRRRLQEQWPAARPAPRRGPAAVL